MSHAACRPCATARPLGWRGGSESAGLGLARREAPKTQRAPAVPKWLWVKNGYPKWNPSKWKHGPKPAVSWWFHFDPYQSESSFGRKGQKNQNGVAGYETETSCQWEQLERMIRPLRGVKGSWLPRRHVGPQKIRRGEPVCIGFGWGPRNAPGQDLGASPPSEGTLRGSDRFGSNL